MRSATISACGRYRYDLTREVGGPLGDPGDMTVNFIMLNPSTADGTADDPTIRRCVGYAKAWGYRFLVVTNLYALRATDPRELARAEDPIGPLNDEFIDRRASGALVVCAWGAFASRRPRWHQVAGRLRARGIALHALGFTSNGDPLHPLYQPAMARPVRWLEPLGAHAAPTT